MKFFVKTDTSPLRRTLWICYLDCKLILHATIFATVIQPRSGVYNSLFTNRLCQLHCTSLYKDRRSRVRPAMTLVRIRAIWSHPGPRAGISHSHPTNRFCQWQHPPLFKDGRSRVRPAMTLVRFRAIWSHPGPEPGSPIPDRYNGSANGNTPRS